MRSVSRRPSRSKRHSSTFVALAENSAKLVPRPSHVAPNGCGEPAEINPLRFRNEKDGSKGWDNNADLRNVTRDNGRYGPRVPDIASGVDSSVGIQDLAPPTRKRHANAIVMENLRSEIHNNQAPFVRAGALSQPGESTVVRIVRNQPLETLRVAIECVQRGQSAIKAIEVADQTLDTSM